MSCSPTRAAARALLACSAALLTFTPGAIADEPPAKPSQPETVIPGATYLRLDWDAVPDSNAEPVAYDVVRNGVVVATSWRIPTAYVYGLAPDTAYEFQINARYADGSISGGEPATITTAAANDPATGPYLCRLPGGTAHRASLVVERLGKKVWPAGQPVQEGPRRLALYLEAGSGDPRSASPWPDLGAATVEPATPQANTFVVFFNWGQPNWQSLISNSPVTLPAAPQPVAIGKRATVIEATTAFSVNTTTSGAFYFGGNLTQTLIARNAAGEPLQLDAPGGGRDGNPDTFELVCSDGTEPPQPRPIEGLELAPDEPVDTLPPTVPVLQPATDVTYTGATINWFASTDNVGVKTYEVRLDGALIATVAAPAQAHTLANLTPDTSYTVTVTAIDHAGNASPASAPVTFKTLNNVPPPPLDFAYTLKGSTTLKSLAKGSLGLSGSLRTGPVSLAAGTFSGDLALNDTSGRLVAAGFLPVTAKLGFAPSGKTAGLVAEGALTTQSKVRIKVKEVKLFGAIPLYAGNSCQTKSLTDLTLKSGPAFNLNAGGTLAGTYAISDLNGCGALNGLVSPLTAGAGNTITLTLTKQ